MTQKEKQEFEENYKRIEERRQKIDKAVGESYAQRINEAPGKALEALALFGAGMLSDFDTVSGVMAAVGGLGVLNYAEDTITYLKDKYEIYLKS